MSARDRYQPAGSFRTALEQRLRAEARASGVPLNRLRKEAAFNRLLARLHRAAPDGWALKGGLALIARLGAQVRGTNDADVNRRATRPDLEEALLRSRTSIWMTGSASTSAMPARCTAKPGGSSVKHSETPTRLEAGIAGDSAILLANMLRRLAEEKP